MEAVGGGGMVTSMVSPHPNPNPNRNPNPHPNQVWRPWVAEGAAQIAPTSAATATAPYDYAKAIAAASGFSVATEAAEAAEASVGRGGMGAAAEEMAEAAEAAEMAEIEAMAAGWSQKGHLLAEMAEAAG